MDSSADARFAFLGDKDLYDLLLRIAFKYFRQDADAEDVRQGACVLALHLILAGRVPTPGYERGWMCRVLKNHARNELRKRTGREPPVDTSEEGPDIPAGDQQELYEEQLRLERLLEVTQETFAKHPQLGRHLLIADGRKEKGAANDPASRKRKERARSLFAAAIGAAMSAAIFLLVLRRNPEAPLVPTTPEWTNANLAAASRELASRSCAAHDDSPCLAHLEQAKILDPSKYGAAEQSAWVAAIADLRTKALGECSKREWTTCVEGLDEARRYDPDGDREPLVQLARSEAAAHTAGTVAPTQPDSKGPLPP
jgi:hypothetical protein